MPNILPSVCLTFQNQPNPTTRLLSGLGFVLATCYTVIY